ncbi:MAG: signal peptide peptidase SppA [Mangrovibacterium sp.]
MREFFKYLLATVLGMLIAGFVGMFLLIGTFTAMLTMSEKPVDIKDKSLLVIRLEDKITERSDNNPLRELELPGFPGSGQIGLDQILESIAGAKTDDRIKGIYLNPSNINAGLATVEEIRNALADFRESGKFVYAYGEELSQIDYYLVSVADKLVLNPNGLLQFHGLSARSNFYKNALEKLGVEVQVVRHGKFKAAVEPYMREEMSPENRLQTSTYLKSIWTRMLTGISSSRGLGTDELNRIADGVATFRDPARLLEMGLVDTLLYKDEVIGELKKLSSLREKNDLRLVDVRRYAKVPPQTDGKGLAPDKIAVIYASGEIDMPGSSVTDGINSEKLSGTIREARQDSSVKAIVLRINSPGGSAYGSEVIWREVKLAAEVKPVIASMGDVAASGGYYIAAAADTILADQTTITGSIGIFGLIPNAGELLNEKLGITQDVVNTNAHADILSLTRKMNGFEQDLMQQYIEYGYDTFIGRVAEGRGMSREQVDEIGQGRVWSAEDALEIGLVDSYGGIREAVALAVERAKLKRYRIVQLPKLKDPFEEILKEITGEARMRIFGHELGTEMQALGEFRMLSRGILARMPCSVRIE